MQQTPLMTQYYKVKAEYPDTILLFRIGDFYETFDEDAKTASKVLGITLTKRGNGAAEDIPLAGFPHHAVDTYLPRLVRAGYRVAICEQVENPKFAKGIVKREVVEVVTPGVAFSERLLEHKKNNYLLAVYQKEGICGLSFCDISTGEFYVYEITSSALKQQIELIAPAEVLIQKREKETLLPMLEKISLHFRISKLDDWIFNLDYAKEQLLAQFGTVTLKGFGIENLSNGIVASGAIINYLQETQKASLPHIKRISLFNPTDYMVLDSSTKRNLEIITSLQDGGKEGSLFDILDKTETPMGGRLLKKWITAPLIKMLPIVQRHEAVEELLKNKESRKNLRNSLKEIGDLERLIAKICTGRANPREVTALKSSLKKIPLIKEEIKNFTSVLIQSIFNSLYNFDHAISIIEKAIVDYPPLSVSDGGVIRSGYSIELDELREISISGKDWIARLQKSEREKTGISSLKVSYNKVFGYYIEISNTHKDKVPADYIRKQTLVNSERYITPELKEYEDKILHAEEKIYELESELFNDVRMRLAADAESVQMTAKQIAMLDCLLSFAWCAEEYKYVKPVMLETGEINIIQGRHPVVERILPPGEKFTPNNCRLDNESNQIIILTGPNMAGKSVYLRQTGLIVLLAQIGSFVPAKEASISIVDRIFTRVGASDNITSGESTFLVEMQEAANILNNATKKSLILLDEIGRGTSTFDGISIAWAITEYIHENQNIAAKTLFATHYHELNEMAEIFPNIQNFKVEVREYDDKVIFLHKVTPGKADHSYGIQVAQMTGLPEFVTTRAKEILHNLESKELTPYEIKKEKLAKAAAKEFQLSLFEIKDDSLRKELDEIELNSITPIEALNKLNELKSKMAEKK